MNETQKLKKPPIPLKCTYYVTAVIYFKGYCATPSSVKGLFLALCSEDPNVVLGIRIRITVAADLYKDGLSSNVSGLYMMAFK